MELVTGARGVSKKFTQSPRQVTGVCVYKRKSGATYMFTSRSYLITWAFNYGDVQLRIV